MPFLNLKAAAASFPAWDYLKLLHTKFFNAVCAAFLPVSMAFNNKVGGYFLLEKVSCHTQKLYHNMP